MHLTRLAVLRVLELFLVRMHVCVRALLVLL
jgi:hypothetical protein